VGFYKLNLMMIRQWLTVLGHPVVITENDEIVC